MLDGNHLLHTELEIARASQVPRDLVAMAFSSVLWQQVRHVLFNGDEVVARGVLVVEVDDDLALDGDWECKVSFPQTLLHLLDRVSYMELVLAF